MAIIPRLCEPLSLSQAAITFFGSIGYTIDLLNPVPFLRHILTRGESDGGTSGVVRHYRRQLGDGVVSVYPVVCMGMIANDPCKAFYLCANELIFPIGQTEDQCVAEAKTVANVIRSKILPDPDTVPACTMFVVFRGE